MQTVWFGIHVLVRSWFMKMSSRVHRCLILSSIVLVSGLSSTHAAGQVIHEDHAYTVSPGIAGWDHFGASISSGRGLMAVGAWNAYSIPDHIPEQGFVYIYEAFTSEQIRILYAPDPIPFGQFGFSIDMDEDVLIVGAPEGWRKIVFTESSGKAYLFDAQTGNELLSFEHADPSLVGGFGQAVAIDNGLAAIWGQTIEPSGTRYGSVFVFDAKTGEQINKFQPAEFGELNYSYGLNLDLDSGLLAVNEQVMRDGTPVGIVKIYDALTGAFVQQIEPQSSGTHTSFGMGISMDQGTIAVSSMAVQGADRRGAVFTFDVGTGNELVKYTPCCGFYEISDNADVKIVDGVVGFGAFDITYGGGVVHLFDSHSGDLIHVLKPRWGGFEMFEISIAMSEGVIGVAHDKADDLVGSGRVYFFGPICSPDINRDNQLNFFDISAFLTAFNENNFAADFSNDVELDFYDINVFLAAYAEGCPN